MDVPEILELLKTESFQHNLNAIEFRKRLLELEVKTNALIEQHPGINYIGQTQQITELIMMAFAWYREHVDDRENDGCSYRRLAEKFLKSREGVQKPVPFDSRYSDHK